MKPRVSLLLTLLFLVWLAGCQSGAGRAGQVTAVPTRDAQASRLAPAMPTHTAVPPATITPTLTPAPTPESDPHTLAQQILAQTILPESENYRVQLCEGEAAVLCVDDGSQNVGFAELLLFPLSGYADEHPLRVAAGQLPADAAAFTPATEAAARQALMALASEHLDIIAADRAITSPDDLFTPLEFEPVYMGGLPALAFGFVRTNDAGEVEERYLNVAAFDAQFIYWFGINFDPPNISTFVSDTAVTGFAPLFYDIAANLAIHPSSPLATGLNDDALAKLLMIQSAADTLPAGWRLIPCTDIASFCLLKAQTKIAWPDLGIVPLSSIDAGDPIRLAAPELPAPGYAFNVPQEALAVQALTAHAEQFLADLVANQQAELPKDMFALRPVEEWKMGPLPAVTFGYDHTNSEGEKASQWRWVFAFDQAQFYWFTAPISPDLPAGESERVTAVVTELAANLPLYDTALRALPVLPPVMTYAEQSGDFPDDLTWRLTTDLPASDTAVSVLSQPAQTNPLTPDQAAAIAKRYGFETPLYVASHPSLGLETAVEQGLFAAFDGARSLSLSGQPYTYSDRSHKGVEQPLPFAQAAPIAEQFLRQNGWLSFPADLVESDQGEGVLFLPLLEGIPLSLPAYGVRVAGSGQVSDVSIYALDTLAPLGRYPILTAEMAWQEVQVRPNAPGRYYRLEWPAADTAVPPAVPKEYTNLPAPGEQGEAYTNIWVFRPLRGDGPPIIQSSEFYRLTGEDAMLNELATQSDFLVHVWGMVSETETGLLQLDLAGWEVVSEAAGLPMFFGTIAREDGQIVLDDSANHTTYRLPNPPSDLQPGEYVAVAGLPQTVDGQAQLAWQRLTVFPPPQAEDNLPPTAVPMQALTIDSVRLVYKSLSASMSGWSDNLFIPTWQFSGMADNGALVTVWVTAVLPDYIDRPAP